MGDGSVGETGRATDDAVPPPPHPLENGEALLSCDGPRQSYRAALAGPPGSFPNQQNGVAKGGRAMRWLPKLGTVGAKALGLAALLLSGAVGLKAQVAYIKEYPALTVIRLESQPGRMAPFGLRRLTPARSGGSRRPASSLNIQFRPPHMGPSGSRRGRMVPCGLPKRCQQDRRGSRRLASSLNIPVPMAKSSPGRSRPGRMRPCGLAETCGNKIGRITTAGVITEYPVPTRTATR